MRKEQLLDENNIPIAPITSEKCVIDENGVEIGAKVKNIISVVRLSKEHTEISDVDSVDFGDLIAQNCPTGYRYLFGCNAHLWPLLTWNYALRIARVNGSIVDYGTSTLQKYIVYMDAVYIKNN